MELSSSPLLLVPLSPSNYFLSVYIIVVELDFVADTLRNSLPTVGFLWLVPNHG